MISNDNVMKRILFKLAYMKPHELRELARDIGVLER
jgi:hypothetical protein